MVIGAETDAGVVGVPDVAGEVGVPLVPVDVADAVESVALPPPPPQADRTLAAISAATSGLILKRIDSMLPDSAKEARRRIRIINFFMHDLSFHIQ
jgi:hypothetical protein